MDAIHTLCPQRTVHPILTVCRDYLRVDQHQCINCGEAERLRQQQQRRRADAYAKGSR